MGAAWSPSPYRNYDKTPWPLPLVSYEGKSIYFRGISFGYKFLNSDHDELSAVVSLLGNQFDHTDTTNPQLRLLSDRKLSGLGGVAWRHHDSWGIVQVTAQKEITGHGGGDSFDANYSYPWVHGNWRFVPTVGATYMTGELNNYYYGVSDSEALRSGLPSYRPGGGTLPYVGIVASYKFTSKWSVSGGARYTALPSAVQDSPMVNGKRAESYFVALGYTF
ncbi:MipA/OmpV family protein [Dyella telluris]|uniref:MipA/OmpV family protein n=1 Tax=Dyella telluris TaxID=2763498 RepID=A0A7G8Q3I3_9GAMM|nr:MipA/OmpV family protein [Dyella telluris]QNK01341.1 MipA/OmpV family protein [Dyella telluris]